MRCSRLVSVLALLLVGAPSFAQQAASKPEGAASKDAKPKAKKEKSPTVSEEEIATSKRRTERLFGPDEPLEFTLAADFKQVFRSRDTLNVKRHKATLTVKDSSGNPVTLAVEISPRGHFRLRNEVCNFPPLRLIFPKTGLKGTPFAGQNALKLGTHCQQRDKEYHEYPVREHATYEVLNMFTDASFRSRLANVTYIPAGEEKEQVTRLAILIEDESDMAKRNGGRIQTVRGGRFADMDPLQTALISTFAYFVGNTDFSLSSLHNVRLVFLADGRYMPVPYDFDWSGAVFARYAKPHPTLGIKTTQERLYRGPCLTTDDLGPIFAKFNAQRTAIRELYARLPLDNDYRKRVGEYYDEFYDTIKDQRRVRREFIDACAGRQGT